MFNLYGKSDSQIQDDVLKELKWDPSVVVSGIDVSTSDGIVTLSGTVPHYFDKVAAEDAAQRVGGVRAVADELSVDMLGSYQRTDKDIAEAALSALAWNSQIPQGVEVAVEKGWITLKGEVEWGYERKAAATAVGQLMGVSGVTNLIRVREKVFPFDTKAAIEDALRRNPVSAGRKIGVSVDGGSVTLSGSAESYSEIETADSAAWSAPGVTNVENKIRLMN